jgi:hypothetical protein
MKFYKATYFLERTDANLLPVADSTAWHVESQDIPDCRNITSFVDNILYDISVLATIGVVCPRMYLDGNIRIRGHSTSRDH